MQILLYSASADASNYIVYEAVNNYGGTGNLSNSIADAEGFFQGMTYNYTQFSTWNTDSGYQDADAWGIDFYNHSLTTIGDSQVSFDAPQDAISWFDGHGTCDAGFPGGCRGFPLQPCSTSSQCTAAKNPFNTGAGVCRNVPGSCVGCASPPACAYETDRYIVTNGSNQTITFSNYSATEPGTVRSAAFGSSTQAGGWAGAGTLNGTNMVVLSLSNGVEPAFWGQNFVRAAAGVHLLATTMPTGGDWANPPDAGAAFAGNWQANHSGIAANAWTTALNSMSAGYGSSCGVNGITNGGYHGYNGCGCNVVISFGATAAEAHNHRLEAWSDVQNDANDGKGASFYYYTWVCNYDSNTYPWWLP